MHSEPLTLVRETDACTERYKACKITRIECFQLDCELADQLVPGHGTDCHCGFVRITTNEGACGVGKFEIPCGSLKGDFVQWAVVFQRLKGLNLKDGLEYVHQKEAAWGAVRTHMLESALTDIAEKLANISASPIERNLPIDRTYLFEHSGAYISF
jgi:L-alanine-DL-glutamate epimerase-like enolase superfamily enzyme